MSTTAVVHDSAAGEAIAAPPWRVGDLLCVALLILSAILLRVGWLHVVSLNTDESQYAAHASYLLGTGQTTFDAPFSPIMAAEVYRWFGAVFGPYHMFELRMLILLISVVMSLMIFDLVRRQLSPLYGLLAGLLFNYTSLYFEALSANREWFAGCALLAALYGYMLLRDRGHRARYASLVAAGMLVGVAVLFKDQAVALAPIVACEAMLDGRSPKWRLRLSSIGMYAAGIAVVVAVYFAIFYFRGTLELIAEIHFGFQRHYAAQRFFEHNFSDDLHMYWREFYQNLPYRRLFLLAYAAPLLLVVSRADAPTKKASPRMLSRVACLVRPFFIYLIFTLFAIQIGDRFFGHYFLFALPPVAILATTGVWALRSAMRNGSLFWGCLVPAVLLLIADVVCLESSYPFQSLALNNRECAVVLLLLGALFGIVRLFAGGAKTAMLCLSLLLAIFSLDFCKAAIEAQFFPEMALRWRGYNPESQPTEVASFLKPQAKQSDLLFVWGWRPEVYAYSGLEAATEFQTSYLLEDLERFDLISVADYDPNKVRLLMGNLESRRPRYLVDTCLQTPFGARYRLDGLPELFTFVQRNYTLIATLDGYDIYRRRSSDSNSTIPWTNNQLVAHYFEQLAEMLRENPENANALSIKADLLAQNGRFDEAEQCYRQVLNLWQGLRGGLLLYKRLKLVQQKRRTALHKNDTIDATGLSPG